MNGRHHVITNVSTVITIDTGLKILSRASDNDIYSKCHNFVLSQILNRSCNSAVLLSILV